MGPERHLLMQAYKRELLNYSKKKKMERKLRTYFIYLFMMAVFDLEYANVKLIIVMVDTEHLH